LVTWRTGWLRGAASAVTWIEKGRSRCSGKTSSAAGSPPAKARARISPPHLASPVAVADPGLALVPVLLVDDRPGLGGADDEGLEVALGLSNAPRSTPSCSTSAPRSRPGSSRLSTPGRDPGAADRGRATLAKATIDATVDPSVTSQSKLTEARHQQEIGRIDVERQRQALAAARREAEAAAPADRAGAGPRRRERPAGLPGRAWRW
jgi:hypothetical protein